jgi:hypothetical protein
MLRTTDSGLLLMRRVGEKEDQDKTFAVLEERETLLPAKCGLETEVTIGEKALGHLVLTGSKDCEGLR